jgi:phage-related tail fiber protein
MSRKQLSDLDFGNVSRIRNLPTPVNSDEPVRLADLNSAVEGVAWKDSCRVASQTNVNLSSPGASIDGITLTSGDRVLVKAQTTTSQNGIYVWNGASSAMTRAPDANTADELEAAVTIIEEGTSAGTSWRQTSVNFTLDTDPVAWTQFGTGAGQASETSAGIAEIATQAETDAGTDDQRIVTPLKLATWSQKVKRYQATIGDGSATQFDVTHNFATRDLIVQVFQNSGNYEQVNCDVALFSTNVVRLNFASAPASNSLRVVVMA